MTTVLGISAFYHDSAAAIIKDGKILAAAQEERFSRKKHDASYPFNAINYVLDESNLNLSQNQDGELEFKSKNSFLHDNVD